ncbi:hypothetical protein IWT140_01584 [Secundilactobacillus pentosiphilus]|uniref:SCP domain-containing protein n=1 Tax=Secundilactobacillus pentosiphilus TaxID=1714682 RepID=A0A1Z5IQE3_9LACO|nr:CAP domain-containing protein [Secundilactobacillus pentosiphilus]GAX03950.1 hypothetical protein IWT140_01584 [Secundilactobacillus pentosiphilus]
MKVKSIMISAATLLSVIGFGAAGTVSSHAGTALAKSKTAKVVKTTNYKSKHKVHVRGGWMYSSSKLTHKNHHMTNYLYTKFYATKKVTIRETSGHKATFNYLVSKDGKEKGYVPASDVWNQWGYGKYSVSAYRKQAISSINQERAKKGLYALKESTTLDKIAQKNSDRMLKDGKKFKIDVEGTPHAGWIVDSYVAPKSIPIIHYENGTQWGEGSVDSWMRYTDQNRDIGAIPYILSKDHTQIGVGGTQHGQSIYMVVLFSHKS